MINKLIELPIAEIISGYSLISEAGKFICNVCGREFESGEIFKVGERYFDAGRMVKMHVKTAHEDMLDIICSFDKKYTGLTENQQELLQMIHSGMSDSEIAKKTGVASATVRHQRFVFREKAKQAKLYLAIYELAFQGTGKRQAVKADDIVDVHKGATMIDDRYFTTKAEEEKIIQTMFSSLEPLKLKTFSSKEKKKIVILKKISEQFEMDRHYSEKEINAIIKVIYEDFATIRRYLIEYGFMERTNDCKEYWLK